MTAPTPMRQCEAIIEDFEHGKSYSGIKGGRTVPLLRACSFKATKKLGSLHLCTRHTAMALDGFVDLTGTVTCRADRANYQKGLVPGRPENWAYALVPHDLQN